MDKEIPEKRAKVASFIERITLKRFQVSFRENFHSFSILVFLKLCLKIASPWSIGESESDKHVQNVYIKGRENKIYNLLIPFLGMSQFVN